MINLPLFPLNLVLLPYELLPLHIFEPRYKKMVKDHIEQDKPFGIILNEDNKVCTKGCRVKVQKVYKKYSNGEYDILVKGVEQFKVINTRIEGETVIGEIVPTQHIETPPMTINISSKLGTASSERFIISFKSGFLLSRILRGLLVNLDFSCSPRRSICSLK